MVDWQTGTLGEYLDALLDYRGKSPPKSDEGVPVLSAKVVKTTGLVRPIEQKIARSFYPKWMVRGFPNVGDVIFTTEGPMGQVIQLDEETVNYALGQRIVCLRGAAGKLDNTFLRYLLISPYQQNILTSFATGTTVLGISQAALRSIPIRFPRIDEQIKIANVLCALDDKIELNRRTNETLERIAQAIFKDWFVDFGPVRRKQDDLREPVTILGGFVSNFARATELAALFPDSFDDDGLPQGWKRQPLRINYVLLMGQSPPGETYNSNGDGLPFFQGRSDFGFRFPEKRIYCSAPTRLAKADETLVSVRAPVGDINRAWEECCIGRGVASVRRASGKTSYTYYAMQVLQQELRKYEHTGTVFGSISRKQFESLESIEPSGELVAAFESIAAPIDARIRLSTEESSTLIEMRDYLLPKLMSGEVSVRDAEKMAG